MKITTKGCLFSVSVLSILGIAVGSSSVNAAELTAFALMPANTFSEGPTSGQFAGTGTGGNPLPLINKQPVQGISAVLQGPTRNTFYIMPDNGFGAKTNSADALLRVYAVKPNFKTWELGKVVGEGSVSPADFHSGKVLPAFNKKSFISLHDPSNQVGFLTVANQTNYPNGNNDIPVDPSIKANHLLTGADFDIESIRKDKKGNLWFGEEFGPFLVQTDFNGKVLRSEVKTPNIAPPGSTATGAEVRSPQNPYLGTELPNLSQSRGFEGMAVNPEGDMLYSLLEGTVLGDNDVDGSVNKNLRINEFDIKSKRYTGNNWLYKIEADGTNIGDMTAVNDHQFLVLERNGGTATSGTPFKKLYLIDIKGVANGGFVQKTELADLMSLADPHDLNGDGSTVFTFPFVTIESVLPLTPRTLLIINDNNYPGTGGRDLNSDNNEFIKIRLDEPLDLEQARCY